MDLNEAEGIARYLAEHASPIGDGSIPDRQNQVVVALLAGLDAKRAEVEELGDDLAVLEVQLDEVVAAGSAAITQLDEAQAQLNRLRAAPRDHCETCSWDGNDETCAVGERS